MRLQLYICDALCEKVAIFLKLIFQYWLNNAKKHAKWRLRDYCSFMWTNTLAISTSSFKVQIHVVFPERVFVTE